MNFLFGFHGRFGRLQWWLGQLALSTWLIMTISMLFILGTENGKPAVTLFIENGEVNMNTILYLALIFIISTWINMAVSIKRFHDRNKSGLWFLIIFIPYIGGLWLLIECGFFPGTEGSNAYDGPENTPTNWSSNKFDNAYQGQNNIDDVIAKHVAAHQPRSPQPTPQRRKLTNKNKPVFGKRV